MKMYVPFNLQFLRIYSRETFTQKYAIRFLVGRDEDVIRKVPYGGAPKVLEKARLSQTITKTKHCFDNRKG